MTERTTAARCWCCDMPLGEAHRVEADRQGCVPCLRAEAGKDWDDA